jgi:hypothetical protein
MGIGQSISKQIKEFNQYRTQMNGTKYSRHRTGETSHRLRQPIVVTHTDLAAQCTRSEWYLVGLIMLDLYENNALWKADVTRKRNSTEYRTAIKGLIDKSILIPTETTHIYIVNPVHLRRGGAVEVTATTANMLINKRPTDDMLRDLKPVDGLDFEGARLLST